MVSRLYGITKHLTDVEAKHNLLRGGVENRPQILPRGFCNAYYHCKVVHHEKLNAAEILMHRLHDVL